MVQAQLHTGSIQGLQREKLTIKREKLYQPLKMNKNWISQKHNYISTLVIRKGFGPKPQNINKRVFHFCTKGPPSSETAQFLSLQILPKKADRGSQPDFLISFPDKRTFPAWHQLCDWKRKNPVYTKEGKQKSQRSWTFAHQSRRWTKFSSSLPHMGHLFVFKRSVVPPLLLCQKKKKHSEATFWTFFPF